MAKKRIDKQETPVKQPEFHTNPFGALKKVVVQPAAKPEPPPKPQPPQPKKVTDDTGVFLEAMQGVKPLGPQPAGQPAPAPAKRPSSPARVPAPDTGPAVVDLETFESEIKRLKLDKTFADSTENDELKPVAVNRLRQLKRGIINVDRQLDLHGLTREEALEALQHFVKSAAIHGEKAVLVITGKGNNSPAEPVLQQAVAGWLRDKGREMVVEFAPAPREMGGSGAFVVFLRLLPKELSGK